MDLLAAKIRRSAGGTVTSFCFVCNYAGSRPGICAGSDLAWKRATKQKRTCAQTMGNFIATWVKERLNQRGVETIYIEPGSPWQNAFGESFNGTEKK
jgi:hypothetical protein